MGTARKPARGAASRGRSAQAEPKEPARRPRLLVGYDGTQTARAAVEWAARTAAPDGEVMLLYAAKPLHSRPDPLSSAEDRHRYGQALLDELYLEMDRARVGVLGRTMVADADPVSALQTAAEHWSADGIVIGCNHRSRARSAIGTVTGELLTKARLPVTVVPGDG